MQIKTLSESEEIVVHIPWFQEANTSSMPWNFIQKECEQRGIWFTRLCLPWDVRDKDELSEFSIKATQERIEELLGWVEGKVKLSSYSLSAIPTINAVKAFSDKVSKVFLIHPAFDILHAVKVMDWLKRSDLEIPAKREVFTHWDQNTVFNNVIWSWRWDASQFQADLIQSDQNLSDMLDSRFIVDDYEHDRITHDTDNSSYRVVWKRRVMVSHIPKLHKSKNLELFLST